ncbi:transposase [Azospirillaceae bacterium]
MAAGSYTTSWDAIHLYDGKTRSEAAQLSGVGLQTIRDWVIVFNKKGPDGLLERKALGRTSILNDDQRQKLSEIVERGPSAEIDGLVRWRLLDLVKGLFDTYRIPISKQTRSRKFRTMKFRKLSTRPRHWSQAPDTIENFKKTSQTKL